MLILVMLPLLNRTHCNCIVNGVLDGCCQSLLHLLSTQTICCMFYKPNVCYSGDLSGLESFFEGRFCEKKRERERERESKQKRIKCPAQ